MIRVRSKRRVVAWAIVVVCCVIFGTTQSRYVMNFFMGPYVMDAAELKLITDASRASHYFVRVTGSEATDTGVEEVRTSKRRGVKTSEKVTARLYALAVGEKLLLCRSSSGRPTTFEGELGAIPRQVEEALFGNYEGQKLRQQFYPIYLTDEPFRFRGYVAIGVGLLLAYLVLRHGRPAWKHMREPLLHPVEQRAANWGDRARVASAVEQASRSPRYVGSGWIIADRFLIRSTFFSFDVLRLEDLVWAYGKVTENKAKATTHEIVLHCHGGSATVETREAKVQEILRFAANRAPWAVVGFSEETARLFKNNPRSFYAEAAHGKQQWLDAYRAGRETAGVKSERRNG